MVDAPSQRSPAAELRRRLRLEARGEAFLLRRAPDGTERVIELAAERRSTVGRGPGVDVDLADDAQVSRLHAEIECLGDAWVLADDGLSRNGSWLNGERLVGRRRLRDGDLLRFGGTELRFRDPARHDPRETHPAGDAPPPPDLTATQRRVLVALCRPFGAGGGYARPATNREIAAALYLSVDGVKGHLRVLSEKLDVGTLPQNEKRLRLVERAFASGVVTRRDLEAT
jgi:hypothetical protein